MAKKSKNFSTSKIVLFALLFLVIGAVVGTSSGLAYYTVNLRKDEKKKDTVSGTVYADFQVHFLEVGNIYTGDAIYIKAGDNDILIDAGSRTSSAGVIKDYIDNYCTDGKLEYVIATHAHQDHIAAFTGTNNLLKAYKIGTIIDFGNQTNSDSTTFKKYKTEVESAIANGAKRYSALECYKNENGAKREYTLGDNIKMEVLYNYYYENKSTNENDYSVCLMFTSGSNKFLLTGDLEEKGEKKLVEKYGDELKADVFKAAHHGSYTASTIELLEKVKPTTCVVTASTGATEYTTKNENTFPSQKFIDRISKYTNQVYATTLCNDYDKGKFESLNGNIIVSSNKSNIAIACSNNDTLLKDTQWFEKNRTMPENWK